MVLGVSVFELHVPEARSLKDKRRVVRSLIDRLHRRHRISIAETGHNDLHQRAEISLAVVARSDGEANRMLDDLRDEIDADGGAWVVHWQPELVEFR